MAMAYGFVAVFVVAAGLYLLAAGAFGLYWRGLEPANR